MKLLMPSEMQQTLWTQFVIKSIDSLHKTPTVILELFNLVNDQNAWKTLKNGRVVMLHSTGLSKKQDCSSHVYSQKHNGYPSKCWQVHSKLCSAAQNDAWPANCSLHLSSQRRGLRTSSSKYKTPYGWAGVETSTIEIHLHCSCI